MRLYDQGRKEDARRILVQIVHARPYQVDALYALGVTSEDLGDTHAAADLYRRVIGLQPDHSPAARRLRQLDDARRAFPRQAARSDPYFAAGGVAGAADRPFEGTLAYRLGQGESASPGERRYRLRRALRTFFPAFIVAGLLSAAAAALKSVAAKNQWYSYETSGALRRVYDDGPNILLLLAVALVIWSLLRYVTTHYEIFDARVDVKKGVLFRRHRVLWLYEIDRRVEFRQSALQTLLATGSILIEADTLPLGRTNILGRLTCGMVSPRQTGRLELIGISTPGEMGRIAEELRSLALRERRAMLNWMMSR